MIKKSMTYSIKALLVATAITSVSCMSASAAEITVTKEGAPSGIQLLSTVNDTNTTIVQDHVHKKDKPSKTNKEKITKEKTHQDKTTKEKTHQDKRTKESDYTSSHHLLDVATASADEVARSMVVDPNAQSSLVPTTIEVNGQVEVASEPALLDNSQVFVPLSVYEKVSPYMVEANQYKTKYFVRMPVSRVEDKTMNMDTYGAGHMIQLPIVTKDNKNYVRVNNSYLGVNYTMDNGILRLSPMGVTMTVPDKISLTSPLIWTFDPLVNEAPYDKTFTKEGTAIISPSLFEMTKDGFKISSKLNADYTLHYHQTGYLVWPLITNQFDPKLTHQIVTAEHRWHDYAEQLTSYALAYNWSGYNLDFENVDLKDKAQLAKFVTYLADYLHQYNMYTSIDVTGYSDSENWSMSYDRPAYANAVDYVVLMAYDETWASSTKAGPVASYPWVKSHLEKLLTEVPADKVVLGVPFYMREWRSPVMNGKVGKAKGKTLWMNKAEAYKEQFKEAVQWDDKLKLHYLALADNKGQLMPYEDVINPKPMNTALNDESMTRTFNGESMSRTLNAGSMSSVASTNAVATGDLSTSMDLSTDTQASSSVAVTKGAVSMNTASQSGSSPMVKPFTGDKLEIWFEDVDSLQPKMDLVKSHHLAGFAAWRKGFEIPAVWDMIGNTFTTPAKPLTAKEAAAKAKADKEQAKAQAKADKERAKAEAKAAKERAKAETKAGAKAAKVRAKAEAAEGK